MKSPVLCVVLLQHLFVACESISPPTSQTTDKNIPIINYKYDFHKDPPSLPGPTDTLAHLEATVSDDFIMRAIDQVVQSDQAYGSYNSDVILKYKPHGTWLWRRWHGTILQASIYKVGFNMLASAMLCVGLRRICGAAWGWGLEPAADECLWVARLKVFDKVWHYQQTLTTFILTFFLGQAYSLWRDMYTAARTIQGRLSDVGILLATHAKRNKNNNNNGPIGGALTDASQVFLRTIARQLRLYHIMVWASQARQFKVLLTNRGLQLMVQRGLLTQEELDALLQTPLSPTQRHNAVIEWILLGIQQGHKDGILHGTEQQKLLLMKVCELRGTCAGIGDILDGRMPLAYAHFVQFLVDSFVFAAPLALFSELGVMSVICVGIMTLFYEGLLDLSKIFLDPLNNEDYCEGGIDMDIGVFIRETNAGSLRWADGLSVMPAATGKSP